MKLRALSIRLAAALAVSACSAAPPPCPAPRIVVDVGHTPDAPGTSSASGVDELTFNRRFANLLNEAVRQNLPPGGAVRLVEIIDPDPRLDRRVDALAEGDPSLVLSVHHDSVQERYLRYRLVDGKTLGSTRSAGGFSLFVPADTPVAAASLDAARTIADALIAAGERPSRHHAEPILGEGRRLLDARRGIYAGDFLKILRTATVPAVLLEVGVIKNPAEEARLADPAVTGRIAEAVARAAVRSACP